MRTWNKTLDTAGINSPQLRHDYTQQRGLVAGYRRHTYVAIRLLLPPVLVPHVIAAVAFMHHTDTLLDATPMPSPADDAYAEWEEEVRRGLTTGESSHPVLRPVLHTIAAHPQLRTHVEEFLAGAPMDRDFVGFTDETDYQHYVDAYSLPAFMLVAGLLVSPDADAAQVRRSCRSYIDGSQRLDFVCDLAEDLDEGRLGLPEQTLKEHDVSREDLEQGRDTPGTRTMLQQALNQARRDLLDSKTLPTLVPPAHRAFIRAFVTLEILTADAAIAKGPAVLRDSASPSVPAALRVLTREYCRRGR
ncbi:phytoene/squalene synthase family protein [Streptomyces sp. WM6378]|uniref:phytoene/squalene synthase family protein n=1 Tax=Streptomyces sp. WM6378 TaxID=1415557 RepID=UPI0006B06319|nr:squalene/phytoene synthase family protein [Streptomyces sp. WM6378]KOU50089.1 phytoene/squalene synthetase [Streptomyces sp. WM6378]